MHFYPGIIALSSIHFSLCLKQLCVLAKCILFICLFCLCLASLAGAADGVARNYVNAVVHSSLTELALAPHSYYLEDTSGEATFEKIISSELDHQFSPVSQENINFGFSDSVFWVRTPLRFEPDESNQNSSLQSIIYVSTAYIDYVDFYWLKDGVLIEHLVTGDQRPFDQRGVWDNNLVLPVTLEQGSEYLLLTKFSTDGSAVLPLSIWQRSDFDRFSRYYSMVMGGYYGILLVMLCYNFFIWLSTRQDSYLSYLVFAVFLMLFQLGTLGHGYEILWRDSIWVQNHIIPFSGVLANFFALRFAYSFLEVKRRMPLLTKWVTALSIFMALFLPFTLFIPNIVGVKVLVAITALGSVTSIACGISAIIDRVPVAKYYVLAWVSLLSSAVIHALTAMGLLEANIMTTHAILIGSSLELVLFSLALAERFSIIQKQSRATLQVANHELRRSNRLKDEFLSTISHELRTPINGIQGALDLMESETDPSEIKDCLKTANYSTDEMLKLVDNILLYSETVRGNAQLHHDIVNPTSLCKHYEKKYQKACESKGLNFIVLNQVANGSGIKTDLTRLEIVLNQLIDNAIKYTEKGTVTVSLAFCKDDETGRLEVSVEDTGIGIPIKDEKELFLAFRQKENSHTRQHQGLGIGLSIVNDVVKDLKGDITYHSVVGSGTQFIVMLPVELIAIETIADPSEITSVTTNTLATAVLEDRNVGESDHSFRILVVEDNPVNQKVLVGMLKKLGYQVLVAENGEIALQQLLVHTVDLILMDCQMPVMDGFEATRAIRALPDPKCQLPIVAVTANAMSSDEQKSLDAGMDDYMKKPVKKVALQNMIMKHLSASESNHQAGED